MCETRLLPLAQAGSWGREPVYKLSNKCKLRACQSVLAVLVQFGLKCCQQHFVSCLGCSTSLCNNTQQRGPTLPG